jgi:uncharacterized protein YraI
MLRHLLAAAALALPLAGAPAAAAPLAMTTADVNLRAGPGTEYPIVTTIPYGAPVSIEGCTSSFTWCDVGWDDARGWVASAYLQVIYRDAPVVLGARVASHIGINIVVFDRAYWTRHYAGRPWYRNWRVHVAR